MPSAFQIVPVHREDWELLGIHWQNSYYVDTCLPFGLHSAPYLFNQFATALHWILTTNYSMSHLIHYLDDYLLMDFPRSPRCGHNIGVFLTVCESLSIPVAMDKLEGPSTTLTFLGLELDSVRQEIHLPQDKLHTILTELSQWPKPRKITKRRLLSLLGLLSFAALAIPAGRLFLRRLIRLSTTVEQLHHHIQLNSDAIADITWWQTFLPDWNGRAFFVNTTTTNAHDLDLYTNASGRLGCRAYFQGHWFHHNWQPHQQLSKHIFIQWQELFAIVAAALTWGHLRSTLKIRFICDNLPIVQAWEGKSSKQPQIMRLLRLLFLTAAKGNFTITLKHIAGITNPIADAIFKAKIHHVLFSSPTGRSRANLNSWYAEQTLTHRLRQLLQHSLAPSTQAAYNTGLRRFYTFYAEHNTPLPATKLTVTSLCPSASTCPHLPSGCTPQPSGQHMFKLAYLTPLSTMCTSNLFWQVYSGSTCPLLLGSAHPSRRGCSLQCCTHSPDPTTSRTRTTRCYQQPSLLPFMASYV